MGEDLQQEFHDKGGFTPTFDAQAIQVDLKGPVTSLDAVINNSVGTDGKSEWERLLGKPVDGILTQDKAFEIYKSFENGFLDFATTLYKSGPEDPPPVLPSPSELIISAFEKHEPDIVEALKESLKASTPETEINSALAGKLTLLMVEGQAGNGAAFNMGDKAFIIMPAEKSPQEQAALLMGINAHDIPPNENMGSAKEWRAGAILHELEHLTDQQFLDQENAPENIEDYQKTLREIDAEHASNELIKPLVSQDYLDYTQDARTIGTIYKLVRSLNNADSTGDEGAAYKHAISDPLNHMEDIKSGDYSIPEHLSDLENIAENVRKKLGFYDEDKILSQDEASLEDVTRAVEELIVETNTAMKFIETDTDHEIEPPLSPDELELAQDYLKAIDDVGFQKVWNEPQQAPAFNNGGLDLDLGTQGAALATNAF